MKDLYSVRVKAIFQKVIAQDKSFILVCAYLFFEYVRPQTIYSSIDIVPWAPLIIVLAITAIIVEGRKRTRPKNLLNASMVAYLLLILLSSLFSTDSARSFDNIRTFSDWFIVYFLIVYAIDDETKFFIFLLSFLLYSFKMSQHGARVWTMRGFAFSNWGISGAQGWFQNSGELGIQMCIFFALSLFFVVALRKYWGRYKRLFFYAFPITSVMVVIGSSSRGALLGCIAALVLPLIKNRNFIRGALLFAAVASTIYYFVPEESKARFQDAGDDRTSLHRLERWEHGYDTMLKHPTFGVGHEAWVTYYPRHYNPVHEGTPLVHNIFVQVGTELGFTGLLLFLYMIYRSFKSCAEVRKFCGHTNNKFLLYMSKGFDSALLAYLISASFVTVQYYPYFWVHIAMVVAMHNVARKEYEAMGQNKETLRAKL